MSKYYLIGKKLPHSYSAKIHIDRGYDYELKEIAENDLGVFVKSGEYAGLNVTVPYKETVMRFLDDIDPSAAKIGAVNTVVKENGKLVGYNTDILGMRFAFDAAEIDVRGRNVLLLGSGGTSKTARTLCEKLGAKSISVVGRNREINYDNCYLKCGDAETVINCTPVGAFPFDAETPIDLHKFTNLKAAYDCTYNPARTEFVLQATAMGAVCDNGLKMLVAQAYESEKLWTGKEYSSEDVLVGANKIYRDTMNVALVGMPGAGKTSASKVLGRLCGREVIDIDETIKRRYGISAEDIIDRYGESYFREIESNVLDEACARRGVIIATGGGTVLREENRKNLKRNCIVVWIRRDLSALPINGRPLSRKFTAEELYDARKSLYEGVSDYSVENDGTIDECAEKIGHLL